MSGSPRRAEATAERCASWDVALVGCGPVGALAANLLGMRGLRTIVLEREQTPYPLPRAVHLDHEMMRLLASAGVLERIEPRMSATDGHIHIGADGGVIRYLGTAGRPRPFSFANDYFFYQPELEEALRGALGRFDHVELRLGAAVTGVTQGDEGVEVIIGGGMREARIRSRYVIGCDGASSTVRKMLGVRLEDLDFEEPWLVVDAEVDGPIRFPTFEGVPDRADLQRLSVMLCDPRRPATIVPGRGTHRRWEFMLLPGESDEEMMQPERVSELIAPWVEGSSCRIVRAATYRFHGLVAEQWRIGRVFLAGDAAHQTPPFFGQGMCHGFRDVANLAWKLDRVLAGRSDGALLDTYPLERDPHVRSVIGTAVEAGRYICELDPERARARDARLREQMRNPPHRTAADLIPPLARGILAGAGSAGEGIGVRFIQPPVEMRSGRIVRLDEATGGGWVFIATGEPDRLLTPEALALWRRIGGKCFGIGRDFADGEGHLAEWLGSRGASAVVVRPDFYTYGIARAGASASALIEALARDLHLTALEEEVA